MNEQVKAKVDLLISNREKMEKGFKWSYSLMNIAAALVFTGDNKEVDLDKLKECKTLVEKNTGVLSSFQSTSEPIIASKMALSNDPLQYLKDTKMVYDKISKGLFSDGGYLINAATCVIDADRLYDAEMLAARFKELYKRMGKEHPFLTSSEDIVFAMLLVLTDKPTDTVIREMEECYTYLRKEIGLKVGANEIQGLGEVLALTDGDMREKCDKVVNLYKAFEAHGSKYGKDYNEFASLGALIDIDVDTDVLVDEIIEAAEYLKTAKGFGSWTLDKKQRLMFAAMLVADVYSDGSNSAGYTAINSTVAAVIAEEVALMISIMAATSAATSTTY